MNTTLNRHLWLLTGRQNDFVTPALNTGRSFGNLPPSEEVAAAREILHLTDASTDYYVIGAMAAMMSFRPIAGDDSSTVFLPHGLNVAAPGISGGVLMPSGRGAPSLLHRPEKLPVPRRWYVTRVSGDLVRITTDTGYQKTTTYRKAGGVVYVDWPEELGFRAAFAPDGGVWNDGSQAVITTEPSGYPYAGVAREIKNSVELVRLMATQGNLSAFHSAQSPIQKVGALAASVVQWGASMTSV